MNRWDRIKRWLKEPWAAYTFAICSGVLLFLICTNLGGFWKILMTFIHYISPVLIGIVIAYILDPLIKFWEFKVFGRMKKKQHARALGVIITFSLIILLIVTFFVALIPQLISSIRLLIDNMSGYGAQLNEMLGSLQEYAEKYNIDISNYTTAGSDLVQIITNRLPQSLNALLNTTISYGVEVFNIVMSSSIAVYMLLDKQRLMNGLNRLWRVIVASEGSYQRSTDFLGRCNHIMLQFILSDLLDGFIVGIANAMFMLIIGYPYVPLISVVVGVTNLAPTFGPIVGGAVGAFILFLSNPWYALGFLIFTFILQTVDGYIIKPKLFGGQLGIPSIWILISIIVFGRMFGVAGILLGIPMAAIIEFVYLEELMPRLERRQKKRAAAIAAAKAGKPKEKKADENPESADTAGAKESGGKEKK